MAAVTELLVITLRQADSGKEQAGQKEVQSVVGGEKKNTRKFNVGAKVCAGRDKEKPDSKGIRE